MSKYDQMLGGISTGLGYNTQIVEHGHGDVLLQALAGPVQKLREQVRWMNEDDRGRH